MAAPSTTSTIVLEQYGLLALDKLVGDPTSEVGTWPSGYTAYYVSGSTIYLCVYDAEVGWKKVALT